jgi:chromosome segregation ATPase
MTDKQIIKQLAERYKEINRNPFADGYTFTAFDGECAKKGFTRDDIKNYIEKEKQERKVKRTESIKSLKEQLKRKEQECEELEKWLPIVTRLENEFENFEKAKAIDYKLSIEQIFIELDQLKAENDTLNFECDTLDFNNRFLQARVDKLEQVILRRNDQIDQLKAENKHLNDLLNQALKELEELQEGLANG